MLVLLATAGMLMMISANDLISLYLGLELQSLALYVLAALRRDDVRSSEAGLKYFVLGALSSGMLLYGASLIYGFTGSTSFANIAAAAQVAGPARTSASSSAWCSCWWASPSRSRPCRSTCGRPTSTRARRRRSTTSSPRRRRWRPWRCSMRVPFGAFPGVEPQWQQVVTALAIASMGLGAFAAIGQTNIKRLLAYSAIGNVGYMLIGLAAGTPEGVRGVVIYLVIYVAMTLGAFACVLCMRRPGGMVEEIDELSGLAQNNLGMATMLAIVLFSMAGIPPLAGLLRQVLRVRRGREGGAVAARRVRRAGQRGRRLLLRAHRQGDVLRRAEGALPRRAAEGRGDHGGVGPVRASLRGLAGAVGQRGRRGGEKPVLNPEQASFDRAVLRYGTSISLVADRMTDCQIGSQVAQSVRSIVLDEVGSTNAEAFKRAEAGERGPLWIVARRQTQGRGRSGRSWGSEPGNLYASLLQTIACPPSAVHQISLLAGVAVIDAIGRRRAACASPGCG